MTLDSTLEQNKGRRIFFENRTGDIYTLLNFAKSIAASSWKCSFEARKALVSLTKLEHIVSDFDYRLTKKR